MTRTETITVMGILKAAYPRYYEDQKLAQQAVNLWADMFADDPVGVVVLAVKALIATNKFVPTIADVKEKIQELTAKTQMSELEAWGYIAKAIKNGYYGAQAEFDKLPPILQKLVGSPAQLREWALMDVTQIQSVVSSNFMRSYRVMAKRESEMAALPEDVRDMMLEAGKAVDMKKLERG